MQTREALARMTGYQDDGPSVRDSRLHARYAAVARAKDAAIAARQTTPGTSAPHARAATRQVQASLGELDPTLPLLSTFDGLRVARAELERHPHDRGLQVITAFLNKRLERDRDSSLSGGQIDRLLTVAVQAGGRTTRAAMVLGEGFARVAYTQHLPVRRLASLAGQVDTQADFDGICRHAGLVGSRPDQILARQFMLGLINRRLAGAGDPMDVAVEETGAWMGGPKASDGGGALSADSMGDQLKAKASKIEAALLDGRTVVQAGFTIGIDDQSQVFLRTSTGAQRVASLASLPLVVRDFLHLTAAADPMDPGAINEQQDPWVDLNPTEGGDLLGKDSQTDDVATNAIDPSGTIKQQHPASDQAGTSSSVPPADKVTVRAELACQKCGVKRQAIFLGAPGWIAQPALWTRVARRSSTYDVLETTYQQQCKKLSLPAHRKQASADQKCHGCGEFSLHVASGAIGPDTSQDEPSWGKPAVRPPSNSKPSDQPGTGLSDPGAASEPDHQQDVPSWEDPGPIETSRKGPTAAISDVTRTDPRARYVAAREGAPTRAILDGIARPGEWAARRMAERFGIEPAPSVREAAFDTNAARFRTDLQQVGVGDLGSVPGQYRYRFAFDVKLGRPHLGQVQAYLDKASGSNGVFAPLRIAQVGPDQLDVVVADTSKAGSVLLVPQPGDSFAQKQSAIRAALTGGDDGNQGGAGMASDYAGTVLNRTGSPGMQVKDVPSAAPDESGGEKNAGAEPDDDACPQCGGYNVEHYGTEGEKQCADCSNIFKKEAAKTCAKCGSSDCQPVEGGYKCAGCGSMTKTASVPEKWENTVKDMKDDPEVDNPFALVNWMDNQGYKPGGKGKKESAKIHENWGDGGAFERSVEAETPGDLWKLHQGLNGGPQPEWPAMQPKPDGAAQAGVPQPPGAPAEEAGLPPQEPEKDSSGKARLPEPEPQQIVGQVPMGPADDDMPPGQVPAVRAAALRWQQGA